MRWEGQRESGNVEDARGQSYGGGGIPIPIGRLLMGGGGIGTVIVLIFLALSLFGPQLGLLGPGGGENRTPSGTDEQKKFVAVVLADTEDVWDRLFRDMGKTYRRPKLRLFTGATESGCGFAEAAVGPFYCPEDERIYLDLDFFEELQSRFHAPGDFARAYVIAHEVGHHVQKLTGVMDKVHQHQQRATSEAEKNHWSVRLELHADFLAGVWAYHAQKMKDILEPGDLESALHAAAAIGDDVLQRRARGYVVPDNFTHGTSKQRVKWFRLGFDTGDMKKGDALFTLPYDQL